MAEEAEELMSCDSCQLPTRKWDVMYIGSYAAEAITHHRAHYCRKCFAKHLQVHLILIGREAQYGTGGQS